MSRASPLVGIIMGSQSDWPTMKHAADILTELGVAYETKIVSAHRTPERLYTYAKSAKGSRVESHHRRRRRRGAPSRHDGFDDDAAGPRRAGREQSAKGQDSLYSIVQMPAGVPVGTLAIGEAGAKNAGLLAAEILALSDNALSDRLEDWRTPALVGSRRNASPRMTEKAMTALPPGSTIGILGGGQLGRMLAMAAARLGLKSHIYAPEADSPAFDVAAAHTIAAYEDEARLAAFADAIDVATYEFENIPVADC